MVRHTDPLPTVVAEVAHHIETTGPSVFIWTCHITPDKYNPAKTEFDNMLDVEIMRSSNSLLASLQVVPKCSGD